MVDQEVVSSSGGGFGGVYLGPATELISTASGGGGASPPERLGPRLSVDLKKSRSPTRTSLKRRQPKDAIVIEIKKEQVWGGVYVGPASEIPISSPTYKIESPLFNATTSSGGFVDEEEDVGLGPSGLMRRLSRTKATKSLRYSTKSGKVKCEICKKKCSGDILKADDKFFHIVCFTCKSCHRPLSEVGFFVKNGEYYCPQDFHTQFGSRCATCNQFVEGEVVICMGKTFHQQCFKCDRCRQPFPAGQKATFTGRESLCQKCVAIPVAKVKPTQAAVTADDHQQQARPISPPGVTSPSCCAACNQQIHSGQVLLALDAQWHIWCFKCTTCGSVLHGEYMTKDGLPFCIRDYNAQFGVRCHECDKYIAGKVLQAGDYPFHPSCALCTRCGLHFEEREEMYMQGDEIWHARCSDIKAPERMMYSTLPRITSPARMSGISYDDSMIHSLPRSPRSSTYSPKYPIDFGKHLTYMYLLPEENVSYLKQPISPHPPQTPQFHMPQGKPVKIRKSRVSLFKTGLQKLAEILDEQQPRAKSPHMNNEEPIEMAHYPSARAPEPHEIPAIERDDFPAPPFPYAVEDLKRRLSSSDLENDEEEEVDLKDGGGTKKMQKAEEELKKYENESSIAKIVVQRLEEEIKKVKAPLFWDPRSASRTPSAKKLPHFKCRYESPINASPSRYLSRPRPWEYWEKNRACTATIPYMQVPKPGYGLAPKAASLPGAYGYYDFHYPLGDLDTTLSSTMSDKSYPHTPTGMYDRYQPSYGSGVLRSSLPDMSKPPKIYTYRELTTTNKRLPEDVDRCHLERHLNREEFERLFDMLPIEFYRLPEWKRINMKRRAKLY